MSLIATMIRQSTLRFASSPLPQVKKLTGEELLKALENCVNRAAEARMSGDASTMLMIESRNQREIKLVRAEILRRMKKEHARQLRHRMM